MKKLRLLGSLALALLLALAFMACDSGSGTGKVDKGDGGTGDDRPIESFAATKNNVTYTLVTGPSKAKAAHLPGDFYTLTAKKSADEKDSSGTVVDFAENVFTLLPSVKDALAFTVTISGTKISNISGTVTYADGSTEQGPGAFATGGSGGGGSSTGTGTGTGTGGSVAVTGVSLNKTNTSLIVGASETLTATVAPSNATDKSVTWVSSNSSIATVVNGTVTGVALGTATVTVTTVDGAKTANCTVTVNPTPITSAQIVVTAPVNGAVPSSAASGTGNFTAGTVSWSPAHSPFQASTVYIASVTLTANSGYTFTGLSSGTINGQSATVSGNIGTAVTLSHAFPATGAKTAASIAIQTQPSLLSYTHGETLNLTGLVVRLTYDDSSTEDIAAANFAARNITASPANGNTLAYVTHNGNPVTVTFGSLPPVTTSNLTVAKAAGTFSAVAAFNTTYTPSLTLASLSLPGGYAWNTPATSLSAGNGQTFPATYTHPSGNYNAASGTITVNVAKAVGAAVSAPTLNAVTSTSITINAVTASTGQTVEYARNTSDTVPSSGWQSGLTFSGLSAGTNYFIFARAVENGNYNTGAASASLSAATTATGQVVVTYYVDSHGALVTSGSTTVAKGAPLTITAQAPGYTVEQWRVDGVDTGQTGTTYIFSSNVPGPHTVGLFVVKDSKLYNTNITITVTP